MYIFDRSILGGNTLDRFWRKKIYLFLLYGIYNIFKCSRVFTLIRFDCITLINFNSILIFTAGVKILNIDNTYFWSHKCNVSTLLYFRWLVIQLQCLQTTPKISNSKSGKRCAWRKITFQSMNIKTGRILEISVFSRNKNLIKTMAAKIKFKNYSLRKMN